MITVGLVRELFFISSFLKTPVTSNLSINDGEKVLIKISDGYLNLWYKDKFIWKEKIEGAASFFGVESCDAISRIIACIDNNDEGWHKYCFIESA